MRYLPLLLISFSAFGSTLDSREKCFGERLQIVTDRLLAADQTQSYSAFVYDRGSSRQELIVALYEQGIVEASDYSAALGDKDVSDAVFRNLLGRKHDTFFPRAMAEHEMLRHLEQKQITTAPQIIEELKILFPHNVIAKPVDSEGIGGKDFFNHYEEVANLLHHRQGTLSEHSQRYLLQAKAGITYGVDAVKEVSAEVRVHVFWGEVMRGLSLERWHGSISNRQLKQAEDFVQTMLDAIPADLRRKLSRRQAWAFDVLIHKSDDPFGHKGEMSIIDMNTNGGERRSWSGFFAHPLYLKGLVHFLSERYEWQFEGWPARRLRWGVGNCREACTNVFETFKRSGFSFTPRR